MITNDFAVISAESEFKDEMTIRPEESPEYERGILGAFDVDTQAGIDHNFLD